MNILLIDDDKHLLKLLRRALVNHGHFITEASNGKQGWEYFVECSTKFDVIVTDLKMPVLDGVELLKRLREREYDVPVIIITGYEDIQSSIEILRLGAFDFLLKPFKSKDLLDILDKLHALQETPKRQLMELPGFIEQIDICIRSQTRFIPPVSSLLQDRLRLYCKLNKLNVRNIGLCLHEALANAIIHGNLDISSSLKNDAPEEFERLLSEREALPEYADRKVTIHCAATASQIKIEIQDEGRGFDQQSLDISDPTKMLPSGRGILIITALMTDVFWNESGNRITMIKEFQL